MVIARLAALVLLLACLAASAPGQAQVPAVDPRDVRLEAVVETLPETPYVQEMVLLTIRGFYDVTIALEELEQPALANFGWMQLGRDTWSSAMWEGRDVTTFERRLALFPQEEGVLTIAPFRHELTLVAADGVRFPFTVASAPAQLAVAAKPETAQGWWLPARAIDVTDAWDGDPAALESGETATRTVTLSVLGVPPQFLPPMPAMRGHNVISFVQPEERSTELTPEGPRSSLTWQWKVRPVSAERGDLPVITIPWFDTASRQTREIVLASQVVDFVDTADGGNGTPGYLDSWAAYASPLAALGGFVLGAGLLVPGLRLRSRAEMDALLRRFVPDADRLALRRAVRRNDAPAARAAARRLLAGPLRGRAARTREALAALASIDRHLYGQQAGQGTFDLEAFAAEVRRAAAGRA